ncbi:hypothetical protein [Streptomyces sp. G-G2]|uniref:hypothetical protein n=1 Tax=Streptomyces sp. G-G2 TaxID=3046201 RepID=UPI0024BAD86D|nr:hypothetical protein [Streptomyces sp. G-G2]MDJ0382382.1 hypothetical protein [Streptomyces sp. G-G2]
MADGSVPNPGYVDASSSGSGGEVRHWSVYDGACTLRPRAAMLRSECSCGWTGEPHPVDWAAAGDRPFRESGSRDAGRCLDDWARHTTQVGEGTVPLPAELEILLENVAAAIESLAHDSPTAAIKAARQLEIIAQRTAHWPAHEARTQDPGNVAAALGLNAEDTRSLLARFGGWSPYS